MKDMLFSKTHEWIQFLDETTVRLGLTDFAQSELGDLVFINLPEEGDEILISESFADVESVKAVSNVYSPVTGTVSRINEELLDHPELVNESPYEAWFVEIENVREQHELLSEEEYQQFIHEEE
ncbi:glycine cleavage system protein GcvH [Anaerocolumna aminovalerica]|jgi:glycine cleavage system H protein|uniref:Glycine cleavage system H protein n=1 Tax=Anaerocolumna aminovalerica TaxID=1527 RepID=A0A1I5G4Z3_9FIRM|nr:glycine cleavage system protein GcvH [Anaerocolumna aminovalerica]MBU5331224.1 glycine cleavage system protein GcvH [Anaerocolumna aminovalerica]MDU6264292.1 glycine cleavage system protein GcvH [Anaerocolumna aminovalerica]SFO31118.1 glycine cleavage system H protein [Anaerocolumna aminovalerica]